MLISTPLPTKYATKNILCIEVGRWVVGISKWIVAFVPVKFFDLFNIEQNLYFLVSHIKLINQLRLCLAQFACSLSPSPFLPLHLCFPPPSRQCCPFPAHKLTTNEQIMRSPSDKNRPSSHNSFNFTTNYAQIAVRSQVFPNPLPPPFYKSFNPGQNESLSKLFAEIFAKALRRFNVPQGTWSRSRPRRI